jgi:hypothetical protein
MEYNYSLKEKSSDWTKKLEAKEKLMTIQKSSMGC